MKTLAHLIGLLILCLFCFEIKAQSRPEQDCIGAVRICDNVNFTVPVTYNGNGNIRDIPRGTSCMANEENNSAWFVFEVDSAGTVVFIIDPLQPDDYDFAVFNATDCSEITNDSIPPVRCNYAAFYSSSPPPFNSPLTGLGFGYTGTSSGVADPTFLAPLEVLAGEKYYLVIDNFRSNGGGYHLDFTGTTAKFKSDSVTVLVYEQLLNYNSIYPSNIRLSFNGLFDCAEVSTDPSLYNISGPSVITVDSVAFNCTGQNTTSGLDIFYSGVFEDSLVYFIEIDTSSQFIPVIDSTSCVQTAFLVGTTYFFRANVIPIDTFIFDIDTIIESRSSSYFSYSVYTVPESPFILTFSDNDYTLDTLNKKIRFTSSGTKEVCAIAYNQLYADTICKTIDVVSGISAAALQQSFSVYPNPATNKIFVKALGNEKIQQITVYDILGKSLIHLFKILKQTISSLIPKRLLQDCIMFKFLQKKMRWQ